MYGKEGKKTNYSPYGCNRIILGQVPNSGDHSGCPFRHFDQNNIKKTIRSNLILNAWKTSLRKL
jgi:DNA primase large subunit